jgi:Glycine-zipper domain
MNRFKSTLAMGLLVLLITSATLVGQAQTQGSRPPSLPDTSRMAYNAMSVGLNLMVFPANGQSRQQQKIDEFDCYVWAMERSGVDPLNLPKVEAAATPSGPSGAAVGGAARGAAAGLAIGAIAGNAGRGAAIGATAGAIGGRNAGRQAQSQQRNQAQANADREQQAIWDSFVRAFSACIAGKGYTVN